MKPVYYPDMLARPPRTSVSFGSHALLVTLAVLLSVLFHLGTMIYFADVEVRPLASGDAAAVRQKYTRQVPPMQVDRIPFDPSNPQYETPEGMTAPTAEAAIEARELVESLTPPADTAVIARETALPPPPSNTFQADLPPPEVIPTPSLDAQVWQPRQEVKTILDRKVDSERPELPRWEIAAIERVADAPDFAASIDTAAAVFSPTDALPDRPLVSASAKGGGIDALFDPPVPPAIADGNLKIDAPDILKPGDTLKNFAEPDIPLPAQEKVVIAANGEQKVVKEEPVVYQSINDKLNLALYTYADPADPDYLYYHLQIHRRSDTDLPVVPKDVIFVQDVSGSISDQRLEYCKRALRAALRTTLRAEDRFNVVAFRDKTAQAFPEWRAVNTSSITYAENFIQGLRSYGTTDLFLSLRELMKFPRDPVRPVIAVIVTDGEPTTGLVETTRIIGEFTRLNDGAISVYTFGTRRNERYFLDMLCYCNRGFSSIAKGGRWDIPNELQPVYESIRNPVMKDLHFSFDAKSGSEVYPRFLTNLYADRPLDLYGRCPVGSREVACQIRGTAPGDAYDAVFRFDLTDQTNRSPDNLRDIWAQRKLFDYLAEVARNPSQELMDALNAHAAAYKLTNPYGKK